MRERERVEEEAQPNIAVSDVSIADTLQLARAYQALASLQQRFVLSTRPLIDDKWCPVGATKRRHHHFGPTCLPTACLLIHNTSRGKLRPCCDQQSIVVSPLSTDTLG